MTTRDVIEFWPSLNTSLFLGAKNFEFWQNFRISNINQWWTLWFWINFHCHSYLRMLATKWRHSQVKRLLRWLAVTQSSMKNVTNLFELNFDQPQFCNACVKFNATGVVRFVSADSPTTLRAQMMFMCKNFSLLSLLFFHPHFSSLSDTDKTCSQFEFHQISIPFSASQYPTSGLSHNLQPPTDNNSLFLEV